MTPAAIAVAQVVAAGVGVAGTVYGVAQSHKAAEAQEEAQDVQQRIAEVEAQRKRALALRQARIQRSRIQNVAAQTGTGGSSGAIGAVQSISSQTNANLSFLDVTSQLAGQATAANKRAAGYKEQANIGSTIGQVGLQYGDFGALYKD
ncbi:hypothetical protein [Vibrio phage VP41s3]|nr:hypothetical protein [Vibrio phage VP41s3]